MRFTDETSIADCWRTFFAHISSEAGVDGSEISELEMTGMMGVFWMGAAAAMYVLDQARKEWLARDEFDVFGDRWNELMGEVAGLLEPLPERAARR